MFGAVQYNAEFPIIQSPKYNYIGNRMHNCARCKRDGGGWRRGGVGCRLPAKSLRDPPLSDLEVSARLRTSLKLQTTPCTAGGTVYSIRTRAFTSIALNIKHLYIAISGTLHWIIVVLCSAFMNFFIPISQTQSCMRRKSGHGVLKILPSSL